MQVMGDGSPHRRKLRSQTEKRFTYFRACDQKYAAASTAKLVAIRQTYTYCRQFAVRAFDLLMKASAAKKGCHLNATPGGDACWCAFSIFHFPSIFHLRNRKNVEKAAISCVF